MLRGPDLQSFTLRRRVYPATLGDTPNALAMSRQIILLGELERNGTSGARQQHVANFLTHLHRTGKRNHVDVVEFIISMADFLRSIDFREPKETKAA